MLPATCNKSPVRGDLAREIAVCVTAGVTCAAGFLICNILHVAENIARNLQHVW